MKRILTFIFLLIITLIQAQEVEKINSLKQIINNTKNDSIKVDALMTYDGIIYTYDAKLDEKLNKEIIQICLQKIKSKSLKAPTKTYFHYCYAYALNNLGLVEYDKSNFLVALNLFTKAYEKAGKFQNKLLKSNVLNNLGMIYRDINSTEKALEYYLKSAAIKLDSNFVGPTYNNIGLCYSELGQYGLAKKYFEKSVYHSKISKDKLNLANSICNIGEIYLKTKKFTIAENYFSKALQLYQEIGNKLGLCYSYQRLGQVNYFLNRDKEAKILLEKALELSIINNFLKIRTRCYDYLHKTNKHAGDLKNAIKNIENFVIYTEKLNLETKNTEIIKKQVEFELDQFKLVNEVKHKKEIELSLEKNKRQQLIIYLISIVLALILIFFAVLNKSFKEVKKQNLVIENQRKEVEFKNKEITDSITYAKRIQTAILPSRALIDTYFKENILFYLPKDIVAGDFYWLEVLSNQILFAVADCTGHGVPGAMVSVVCHNALNRSVKEFGLVQPGEILDKTREIVISEFEKSGKNVKDGMDISVVSLTYELTEQKEIVYKSLRWSGANNPLWILRKDEKGANELFEKKAQKQPIGKFDNASNFETIEISIQKNDWIYLFTDGFSDQFGNAYASNITGKKFKTKKLKELLLNNTTSTAYQQEKDLSDVFHTWKGNLEQVDDVCIIGIRI